MMNFRAFRYAFFTVFFLLLLSHSARAQSCATDINDDGVVDGKDLAMILSAWGACPIVISSVSPLQGSVLGGTEITINGSGLSTATAVTVGGAPCTNITVVSPRQIRATTPAGGVGTAEIVVTAGAGSESAPSEFTYMQQTITSIFPSAGHFSGGSLITISGSYLGGTTGVTFGGVPATSLEVVDATTVRAVTPAGSVGAVDVVIEGSKGSVMAAGRFSFVSTTTPSWSEAIELLPDPAVVGDPTLRQAIADTGLAWRVRDTATDIELVLIPPGTFVMGCSSSSMLSCALSDDENPTRQVWLTQPFYLGRHEVTQATWVSTMGSNPSHFGPSNGYEDEPTRPVDQVSWHMAAEFASKVQMRLPTEAEWEYAYRAGTTTALHGFEGHPSGTNDNALLGQIAWFRGNAQDRTHAVGQKLPNGYGLFDMSGNVEEWVNDWYAASYYSTGPLVDPVGPEAGLFRVLRGDCWSQYQNYFRASSRGRQNPTVAWSYYGFRVARNP
jgi:formylglycine-generating enzyme required for sulfatase activity